MNATSTLVSTVSVLLCIFIVHPPITHSFHSPPKLLSTPRLNKTPPITPSSYMATVIIKLMINPELLPLAARVYFNYNQQSRRVDSSNPEGIASTFTFAENGTEYIYVYNNKKPSTCQVLTDVQVILPSPNWLSNATYMGTAEVIGKTCDHWQGTGPHIGPNLGNANATWDFYCLTNEDVFTPVLISNNAFEQYFAEFLNEDFSKLLLAPPKICIQ
eukprot:TRINITY_DN3633_c0_g1_i1.p1 TRINITY_DN3633_c0_g1~~TRINITY_DN3633_c0_g1_i1.p1  ORF type:complete len:216 (+),score=17.81 TRINITY_DN3633_c0_g1_i1:43-690(+)